MRRVGVHLPPNGSFNDMESPDYREQFTFVVRQVHALVKIEFIEPTGAEVRPI